MISVLIVEDDPMVREINKVFVEKVEGFKCMSMVSTVEEAKEYITKEKIDLILLDMFLASGKGLDLLKWIRGNNIEVDVILITADNMRESINETLRYGAIDYLIKPFTLERFKEALEKYKKRYNQFLVQEIVNQKEIDTYIIGNEQIIKNEKVITKDEDLEKGININTYNKVIKLMLDNDKEMTAEKIAEEVGLARVTARRYLEYMVRKNKVELIQIYGKIGRPTNFYKHIR